MNLPTVGWLCNVLGCEVPAIDPATLLGPISIDTRTIQAGDAFWALAGDRDGHEFVTTAFEQGAKLAVVDQAWARLHSDLSKFPLVRTGNTRSALTQAGSAWRDEWTFPVLGITGTNGKTSTKDLILRLLSLCYPAAGTRGNLNNELGVPLTLLEIARDCEIAVIEMGASHAGEIGELCDIYRPTHGLVTSIGKAHLEGFGTLDAVAKTKGELYEAVAHRGVAFVPTDDELCRREAEQNRQRIGYGFQAPPETWMAEFHRGEELHYDEQGCARFRFAGTDITLSIPGKPAAISALAALTVAGHFGISPQECKEAIAAWQGVQGRACVLQIGGMTIIDDTYNANPASMIAAIETLSVLPGTRKIAILGDMNELGDYAESEHRELGQALARYHFDRVILIGPLSKLTAEAARAVGVKSDYFADYAELEPHLADVVKAGDAILVKASRGVKLERAIRQLMKVFG